MPNLEEKVSFDALNAKEGEQPLKSQFDDLYDKIMSYPNTNYIDDNGQETTIGAQSGDGIGETCLIIQKNTPGDNGETTQTRLTKGTDGNFRKETIKYDNESGERITTEESENISDNDLREFISNIKTEIGNVRSYRQKQIERQRIEKIQQEKEKEEKEENKENGMDELDELIESAYE